MFHYLIKIKYDGLRYSGWQRLSDNHNTIQEIIENVLSEYFKCNIHTSASGRTDAGVSALSQYADFSINIELTNTNNFIISINKELPADITILSIHRVPDNFHSRKSAISKTYVYSISLNSRNDVFTRKYVYNISDTPIMYNFGSIDKLSLDLKAMNIAADYMCGTFDFSAFTSDKTAGKSHIRTINFIKFNIISSNSYNKVLEISINGNGFLYNMVRIMAGTLLTVGLGRMQANCIPDIIEAGIRKNAGPTLPANGLLLNDVYYE